MKIGTMYLRDKWGWPIETYEGFYPVTNFLRLVIHTNITKTWKHRKDPLRIHAQADPDCNQTQEIK